jgi:predicted AlkP superfamily pyrophosphatase or phosphodiesterase
MTSVFPTKTFPNHYTLVTGLHSESHGIVSNVFYDPVLDETFKYTDSAVANQAKWWGGEPVRRRGRGCWG